MSSGKKLVGKDLTTGKIYPLLIAFAVPIILTGLIQQIYSMTDLVIIGKYVGSVGTVGVSTGGELSDLMTPLASSLAMAGQIYIAQLVGQHAEERLKSVISTLLTMMLLISIIFMVGSLVFYHQILTMLNCPSEAFSAAASYLIITALGMPFIFGYNAITSILMGMGESKRPLLFVSVAAAMNIVFDLLFVIVFKMDVVGTAIATVGSQIGAFAASFIFMYKRRDQLGFELKLSYFKMNRRDLQIIMKLGIPQIIRVISVQGSMLWVKACINNFGLIVSATYSVGNKIEKFENVFVQGITQAGGAMIGQNIGAKKHDRVNDVMKSILVCSTALALIGAVLFVVFPTQLYSIFSNDADVIQYGVTFLRIMAIGIIVSAVAASFKSIAIGAGAALLALLIGILDGMCRVVICLAAILIIGNVSNAYFWGAAFCQVIPGLMCLGYFLSGKWKTKKLLSED